MLCVKLFNNETKAWFLPEKVAQLGGGEVCWFIGPILLRLCFLESIFFTSEEYDLLIETRRVKLSFQLVAFCLQNIYPVIDLEQEKNGDGEPDLPMVSKLVKKIAESPLGKPLLHVLGSAYIEYCDKYRAVMSHDVGNQIRNDVKTFTRLIRGSFRLAQASAGVAHGVVKLQKQLGQLPSTSKMPSKLSPLELGENFVDLIWYLISEEVRELARDVVRIALYDSSLNKRQRLELCQAIRLLGVRMKKGGQSFEWGAGHTEILGML